MPRALLSVYNKKGIQELARGLSGLGWEIISTGGTARALEDAGVVVTKVEDVTGFPEMLDGRVKTLHPVIHGGLLARRDLPPHMEALQEHGISPIDLVAVNLYPFRETVDDPNVRFEDAIEQIDIGGPSMLRSAAKNHAAVLPLVDPTDYDLVLEALRNDAVDETLRGDLAMKVFAHTSAYDAAIAEYFAKDEFGLPSFINLSLNRTQTLRYGENPNQAAALYTTGEPDGIGEMWQRHGKELSFNNLIDIDGAMMSVGGWSDRVACAIIKHTTPCGVALGNTTVEAYRRALATDPTSAFGSVVAFNTVVDAPTAEAMADLFVEVVVAPRFRDGAVAVFERKKNLRVVEMPLAAPAGSVSFDFKRVRGGFLAQERFAYSTDQTSWKVATQREPTADEWRDLYFAWTAVANVKSNAILLAKDEAAIGIGAGQMSRVDASFLAVHKANREGHDPKGSVLASDAFFPFADGVEEAAKAGVTAIVQPGGSKRDEEVIAAADEHGLAMVLTGRRQFRH
ncbi:MAG: bifunctional phosphoribosylaminoimidazolecarboxamide formyltransferase/IMP cyclohydrolase [Gemmatimonadetes bacterium]|nr:bifunctional phosphoribosylaminoimidazolecarboxamide formyltransferase/IMP cyclohydrolase [Gemmatimonadota bacterium]